MSGQNIFTERRLEIAREFGLRINDRLIRVLPAKLIDQLDACADDEARRLILGVSK